MKSGKHTPCHPSFCNCPQFSYPNLLGRPQGFLLNNSQVEDTREDENQHCSRRGSWKRKQSWVLHHLTEKESGAPAREPVGRQQPFWAQLHKGLSLQTTFMESCRCPNTNLGAWGLKRHFLLGGFFQSGVAACGGDVCMSAGEARANRHSQGGMTLESRYQKERGWCVPKNCPLLSAQQNAAWWPRYKRQGGANQLQKPHGGIFPEGICIPESSSTSEHGGSSWTSLVRGQNWPKESGRERTVNIKRNVSLFSFF